jgi:archaetidylinositol phosphate synthase
MEKSSFQAAERVQLSFLAKIEKKALVWMAQRMPQWVNSDHLTLLGFAAMLGAGLSYWYARSNRLGLLLVIVFLAVNWFGDSLDGTLARIRNRQRPRYGFYVDHIVDAFSTLFLLGGLALSGYMSPLIAAGLLIAYSLLSIEVYLATYTIGTFHLSFWGFGPTELRLLLVVANLIVYFGLSQPVLILGQSYRFFDVGGAVGIAGMMLMLIVAAVRHTIVLYRAEPLP